MLKDTRILVSGGTGFVGSHLVEQLVNSGASVVTTYQKTDPKSYFITENLQKKVVTEHIDITDFTKMWELVTKHDIEYIFHLAAQPIVTIAYNNPRQTFLTNVTGTVNILESARLYGKIKGIIVASSDKAYGKLSAKTKAYVESDPLAGDHPYEVSKSAADLICYSYFKTYGLPVVTTRFGNIYGEGDLNFSRIIPGIMKSLIRNEILQIRSNGKYIRDYLYIKDVVNGYLLLLKHIDKVKGEAFNFGSSQPLSVHEVIVLAEKTLKVKIKYKILDTAQNEIPYQHLQFAKIKKLGWKNESSLEETLGQIYSWYEKIL